MFPPRFHGTVFTVLYSNESHSKTPTKAHLITSSENFELISSDWSTSFQKFEPADISSIDNKKTSVVLTMKPGSKVTTITLTTKPFPSDSLAAALTVIFQIPRPELKFCALSEILPTFNFKELLQSMAIHKNLMEASSALIYLFKEETTSNTPEPHAPLVDALTCLFRMRYRNSTVVPAAQSVPATVLSVQRYLITLWCKAIGNCVNVTEDVAENTFHLQIAVNATATVSKICAKIGIQCEQLAEAVDHFAESGTPEGVAAAALELENTVKREMEQEINGLNSCDPGRVRLMQHEVATLLAAVLIGLYNVDIDEFVVKIIATAKAAVQKDDTEERKSLAIAHENFVLDMLGYLDGLRYEEMFQFVFCLAGPAPSEVGRMQFE
jgi:hypothetical protein